MSIEMLRPKQASLRFHVSQTTLAEWADRGMIGRSRVGKAVFYVASDIADVIAFGLTPRTVLPITADSTALPPDESWRDDPLWAGTVAGRQQ